AIARVDTGSRTCLRRKCGFAKTKNPEGVRLYAGAGTNLGLHLNLRAYLQQPDSSKQTQSSATASAEGSQEKCKKRPLPASPDSNATTLVLPGHRSDQEDEASSEVEVCSEAPPHTPPPKRVLGQEPLFLTQLEQQLQSALVSPHCSLSSEHRLLVAKLKEEVQEALAPSTKDAANRTRFAVLDHVAELQARGQALLLEVEDSMQTSMATQASPAASSRPATPAKPEAQPEHRVRCAHLEETPFFALRKARQSKEA
ncbi:unnamed protein product, partial [Symbiodinium necroappetens]